MPVDCFAFGATPGPLRLLTEWLVEHEVEEVVMESTAHYWRPGWDALERDWQPTRLTLSFVPDVTQRLWRTVTRRQYLPTTVRKTGGGILQRHRARQPCIPRRSHPVPFEARQRLARAQHCR